MMDAAAGFSPVFADGRPDLTSPHAPGHRFSNIGDEAKAAADRAYAERTERMSNSWRRDDQHQEPVRDAQRTLDQLETAAVDAYEESSAKMRDAWRRP